MPLWNRTELLEQRLQLKGQIIYKDGSPFYRVPYQGKVVELPIIHRDSPIIGGVCLGANEREAFYISPNSRRLLRFYEIAKRKASAGGTVRRDRILPAIYETVGEGMRYNNDAVESIVRSQGAENDGLISLGVFIENGVGVCRHMGTTCAALMELATNDAELQRTDNHLRGRPSVDRNTVESGGKHLGHTWGSYLSHDKSRAVLDVAQRVFGWLDEPAIVEGIRNGTVWPYLRPDEVGPPYCYLHV